MAYLEIRQTGPLSGTYRVQGSKNAVLPMLAATLLVPGKTTLHRVPKIKDVNVMLEILHLLGNNWVIPEKLIGQMRSSVILLAPILYRMKKAAVVEPGGCSIGRRPIDIHLYVLQALGVKLHYEWEEHIFAQADYFCGAHLFLKFPSVGATEQAESQRLQSFAVCFVVWVQKSQEIRQDAS